VSAPAAFTEMRAGLIALGLLTADFRLTDAGRTHTDALIATLRTSEATGEPDKPRVGWNSKGRGLGWRVPADG
jgi:hypothetical protein